MGARKANLKEMSLGFVNPLFRPRSNGIVMNENNQMVTAKNRLDFKDNLVLDNGGLEDRKMRRAGSIMSSTSTDLIIPQQNSGVNVISLEPKIGVSTGRTSGSRREQ